jgi:creatinine amidohydrolase
VRFDEMTFRDIETIALPALPFGPTPEHRGFGAGYVDLPIDVHEAVISAVLRSLIAQGFRRVLVWRGWGGHDLRRSIDDVKRDDHDIVVAMPELSLGEMGRRLGDPAVPGGRANSFTTSIALALWPHHVRLDLTRYRLRQEVGAWLVEQVLDLHQGIVAL